MRKSQLGMAVAAALGAACMVPATSYGFSVDAATGTLVSDSGGDTLLLPIYTTAAGATTSFSVTNTGDETIAAKIRFREQVNSMDVLDFIVVFSPEDKFDFWVEQGPDDARPVMKWNDNTCVVGPSTSGTQMFPAPSNFVATSEQMSVGHVEMLGMAVVDDICVDETSGAVEDPHRPLGDSCDGGYISMGEAAKHGVDGMPADCGVLVKTLNSTTEVESIHNQALALPVDNDLVGRYVITGADAGIEGGGDAIAIQNSDLYLTAQSSLPCVSCALASPALATIPAGDTGWYAWDQLEFDHPHLGEIANLALFQAALTASVVQGDWSSNPANYVGVDWVLSFPTKYAYIDYIPEGDCDGSSGTDDAWCLLYASRTGFGAAGTWTTDPAPDLGTLDLCLKDNTPLTWDTEEAVSSGNVTVSPGTNLELNICNETTVLTQVSAGDTPQPSIIQTEDDRLIVEFDNLDAVRGWQELQLGWPAGSTGDAITGIIYTIRSTGDASASNGSITSLQKRD